MELQHSQLSAPDSTHLKKTTFWLMLTSILGSFFVKSRLTSPIPDENMARGYTAALRQLPMKATVFQHWIRVVLLDSSEAQALALAASLTWHAVGHDLASAVLNLKLREKDHLAFFTLADWSHHIYRLMSREAVV